MRRILPYLIVTTWAISAYSNVFFMFVPYLALKGFFPEDVGMVVGVFYATTMLARPLGGWIAERVGTRRALVISSLLCVGTAFFMFAASSFWPFLSIRLMMGCGYGVFVVALTTYQSLVIPEETRGRAFAFITLGSLSCLFTVVPLADWLLANNHLTAFLLLPVFTAALCLVLSFRLPPLPANWNDAPDALKKWGTWSDLRDETPFARTAISCVLFGLCDAAIVYLPALAVAMELAPSAFVVANGLGALTIRILGYNFFNRYPRYLFAGPSLLVMAFFLYLTTLSTSNSHLFLCGFCNGVGMGYGYPAHLALVGDLAPLRLRAKMSSLVYFCYDASWFALPVAVGFATPRMGEIGAFKFLGLLCVASGLGVTAMWARYAKKLVANAPNRPCC
jgi:MFS family permease